MPTLSIKTNTTSVDRISQSDVVREASALVADLLGKPEAYVMVLLEAGVTMAFGGTEEPAAFVELVSLGSIGGEKNKTISKGICEFVQAKLGVAPNRTYIHFIDPPRSNFGFNSSTFAK
ncbi:macrophage migration inhibitory factor-like protein [Chloropicon primus]|uniref:L-dopachrome isomerase n=1 Tax=Chloropicon primus TaxID=1764295 RepID=A0A5B8MQZ6_9CHLO|nr:macrophage migration inhibitory factor-like protein [Chloropicon primus]UPR01265.1 macrophage migration inhibitory factor-like protein [Chloropicon primus]|eukprot:QDZ22045.1 macrophage migration inhibitory factor-like protein [Chloropicon primus]